MTVPGDTAQFEAFMVANRDRVVELSDQAKAGGCLAPRFAVGDGQVVVLDEWASAEKYEAFISSPEIQAVMGDHGQR